MKRKLNKLIYVDRSFIVNRELQTIHYLSLHRISVFLRYAVQTYMDGSADHLKQINYAQNRKVRFHILIGFNDRVDLVRSPLVFAKLISKVEV